MPASERRRQTPFSHSRSPAFVQTTCDRVSRMESTPLSQFEVIYIVTNGDE